MNLLSNTSLCGQCSEGQIRPNVEPGPKRCFLQSHTKLLMFKKTPFNSWKAFSQALLQGRVGAVVSCCKLPGVRSFVLKVRSMSGQTMLLAKPPAEQVLVSVLTKGKVLRLNSSPRPRLSQDSWAGPFLCPGAPVQHPVCVLPPVPRPCWKRQSSAGGALRGGVPRACPAVITEGARRPAPSQSGFSFKPERLFVQGQWEYVWQQMPMGQCPAHSSCSFLRTGPPTEVDLKS